MKQSKEHKGPSFKKLDLIGKVSSKTGLATKEVSAVLEVLMDEIKNQVAQGKVVTLRGFGTFVAKYAKEKKVRDIGRNKQLSLPAHYKPRFEPSPRFKDIVKDNLKT